MSEAVSTWAILWVSPARCFPAGAVSIHKGHRRIRAIVGRFLYNFIVPIDLAFRFLPRDEISLLNDTRAIPGIEGDEMA